MKGLEWVEYTADNKWYWESVEKRAAELNSVFIIDKQRVCAVMYLVWRINTVQVTLLGITGHIGDNAEHTDMLGTRLCEPRGFVDIAKNVEQYQTDVGVKYAEKSIRGWNVADAALVQLPPPLNRYGSTKMVVVLYVMLN